MRFLKRSLTGIFLLSVTLSLFAWAGFTVFTAVQERMNAEERQRPARERVFAANVMTLTPSTVTPEMALFGEVRSRRSLEIRASSGGSLTEVAPEFVEGGTVVAGQLLARIDPIDAELARDRTLTDLADAEAELRDAQNAVTLASDEVAAAVEQADLRQRAFERQRDLRDRGVGTEAAVETAELSASSARQSVLSRRQALAQAEARVSQAQTRLARAQIAVTEAERRVADTEIRAGFSGTLSGVSVVEGGLVSNNERLGVLVDPTALEVSFRVSTTQYSRLIDDTGALTQAPVTVVLDVLGIDLQAQGKLTRESAEVGDGQTGRLLFAQLEDVRGFRPGDFVSVKAAEPPLNRVAQIPAAALAADNTVLVLGDEDRLERAEVQLLRRQGDDVIIRARGLNGREIVAELSPLLGEGIRVRPLRPDDGNGTAPEEPEFVELTPERRAKLVAFIEGNQFIPADAKERVLSQLAQERVPARVVARIEGRMGG
jgi:multidrug efflux pump subunit AcrA (membrane-fusion protein)